ncbi:hypothetical protein RN001_008001 [Aquatica leii]|uniref:Uncharacterized protein n=1 Tax=Aquatica leii TaxID=1421715 RepID=A0AAN7SR66_9COLE|nr:hypothetical protein RN001_008001 [Aquatica leii]
MIDKELLLKQDDLQDHRLAKKRDHNTTTLNSLLRIESESLAKTMAKEDMMQYSLKIHLQEMQEIKETLKEPVSNLVAHKENLKHQMELVNIYRSQVQNEMLNTEKMKNMLLEHYAQIRSSYELEYKNVTVLNNKYKEQLDNYQLQEENILKKIKDKKAHISQIQDCNKLDLLQYETELNKQNRDLTELLEANNKIKIEVDDAKSQVEVVKTKYEKENLMFIGLNHDIRFVQNSINNYSSLIDDLDAKRTKDKENDNLVLENIKEEINAYTKVLAEIESNETILQNSCIEESNKSNDLDELFSKLEAEVAESHIEKQKLIEEKNDIINKSNCVKLNLNNDLDSIQLKENEIKELLHPIDSIQEDKLKKEESYKQIIHETELKFKELQDVKTKLITDNLVNTTKLESLLHQTSETNANIDALKLSFAEVQEKLLKEKEMSKQIDLDLDDKLLVAKRQLQEVTNQYETTRKNIEIKINDYKHQIQLVHQQNQDDNEIVIEELSNKVTELKSGLDQKSQLLSETTRLRIEKKETHEKYLKELQDLQKDISSCRFKDSNADKPKPVGILKSPGKTAVSPKKVKFDVTKDSITESESEIHSTLCNFQHLRI